MSIEQQGSSPTSNDLLASRIAENSLAALTGTEPLRGRLTRSSAHEPENGQPEVEIKQWTTVDSCEGLVHSRPPNIAYGESLRKWIVGIEDIVSKSSNPRCAA